MHWLHRDKVPVKFSKENEKPKDVKDLKYFDNMFLKESVKDTPID